MGRNWTLKNESDEGKGIFKRLVIEEFGGNTTDIFILKEENPTLNLAKRTFYVGSEQDLNDIDWSSDLFR